MALPRSRHTPSAVAARARSERPTLRSRSPNGNPRPIESSMPEDDLATSRMALYISGSTIRHGSSSNESGSSCHIAHLRRLRTQRHDDPWTCFVIILRQVDLRWHCLRARMRMVNRQNIGASLPQRDLGLEQVGGIGEITRSRSPVRCAAGGTTIPAFQCPPGFRRLQAATHACNAQPLRHEYRGESQVAGLAIGRPSCLSSANAHSGNSAVERYRSPRSGRTTTSSLPAFSGRLAT